MSHESQTEKMIRQAREQPLCLAPDVCGYPGGPCVEPSRCPQVKADRARSRVTGWARRGLVGRLSPLTDQELALLWARDYEASDEGWLTVRPLGDRDLSPREFHRLLVEVERLRWQVSEDRFALIERAYEIQIDEHEKDNQLLRHVLARIAATDPEPGGIASLAEARTLAADTLAQAPARRPFPIGERRPRHDEGGG